MLNPRLTSKISYDKILNDLQSEAVNWSGVLPLRWRNQSDCRVFNLWSESSRKDLCSSTWWPMLAKSRFHEMILFYELRLPSFFMLLAGENWTASARDLHVIEQIEERRKIFQRDFQKAVYLKILDCLDVFICVQTGSGKTYCFASLSELFPLLHKAEWPIDNNLWL